MSRRPKLIVIEPPPSSTRHERDDRFCTELMHLLNRHSMENDSNTPDYVLASYMVKCLHAFNEARNLSASHQVRKRLPLRR